MDFFPKEKGSDLIQLFMRRKAFATVDLQDKIIKKFFILRAEEKKQKENFVLVDKFIKSFSGQFFMF